jgi:Tfp pilus assembly protein PilN
MIYLRTSVGIELRGEDMLISSLQSNFSGGTFTHFKRIPGYKLREKESLQREIQLFFRSNRLSKENIVLGIPRRDLVFRYLDLPSEVADNLKQVVHYQVQSFEPTEEDKFYYDYVPMGGNGGRKRITILLVMIKKALLDDHLRFLRGIGIRPGMVLGSSIALSNVFLRNRKDVQDKTYILADLGTFSLELMAVHHGAFAYSREVDREAGQTWKDLILREIDEAVSKIRLGPDGTLEKIMLAGEASALAQEEIKAEVPDCELLKNSIPFDVPGENVRHFQEAISSLGLAFTGMARRPAIKLNLLPAELRMRQTRWAYVPAALFGLAIVALLLALAFHDMVQNRILIRKLDQEIQALKVPVEKVQSYRSRADALEKKIKSMEELLSKRDMNLEILQELTTILPPDTYLSTFSNRDGTIQIAGSSGSSSDLIPKLEKSSLLKDVSTRGPIFKDPRTGKDRFTFEAKLEK